MADFCRHCSIQLFGKDYKELASLGPAADEEGIPWYYAVLCEGCGAIYVNVRGERVTPLDESVDYAPIFDGRYFNEWSAQNG